MLRFLVLSLCWSTITSASHESSHSAARKGDATRPYIHYCRSPSMETFTCWWHPLGNGSQGNDNVTYRLLYTIGKGPPKECPDYVSGGLNSCYFDIEHTRIWEVYCMNVTAHSHKGFITSEQHCLDVADIVEIDPPFNLTYMLMNTSDNESGRTALVSWQYPIAQQVHIGWITLIYELRYRSVSEPSNWKVKERLREPHLELLDLPVGTYEVQVRCRSKNNHLWSKWSSTLNIVIPAKQMPDRMLYALVLVTGVGVGIMMLLIIGFGVIPQGKRIKAFLLPPIPKPRIRGIDPMLLKKGRIEEINRHFSTLHSYKPPQYCEETWYQVSMDEGHSLSHPTPPSKPKENRVKSPPNGQSPTYPERQQLLQTPDGPAPYCQGPVNFGESPTYYREETLEVALPSESDSWAWPTSSHAQPELMSFPGMDYSMILNPTPLSINPPDFYTCVNRVTPSGAVHLVPCMSNPAKGSPYLQLTEEPEQESNKNSQLAVYLEKQAEAAANGSTVSPGEAEQGEFAVPLLTHLMERS